MGAAALAPLAPLVGCSACAASAGYVYQGVRAGQCQNDVVDAVLDVLAREGRRVRCAIRFWKKIERLQSLPFVGSFRTRDSPLAHSGVIICIGAPHRLGPPQPRNPAIDADSMSAASSASGVQGAEGVEQWPEYWVKMEFVLEGLIFAQGELVHLEAMGAVPGETSREEARVDVPVQAVISVLRFCSPWKYDITGKNCHHFSAELYSGLAELSWPNGESIPSGVPSWSSLPGGCPAAAEPCAVCLDRARSVAFVPCGHRACCQGCAAQVQRCVICNALVAGRQRVYDA